MVTDQSEPSPFAYAPLAPGQIRLLVPDTSRANDGHSWTLQVAALRAELDYDTLSYTWGSQNESFSITCNGLQLRVHRNLYDALPFLARRNRTGNVTTQPIWIDAVCINQADDEEKYTQINMMHRIYKGARKVWAWFGVPTEQAKMSHFLSLLPAVIAYNKQISTSSDDSTRERPEELRQLDITYRDTIFHLFQNPWFRRTWVVQEGVLARSISYLCGDHEIEFEALNEAIDTERFRHWRWNDATGLPVQHPYMTMRYEALPDIRYFFRSEKIHEGDTTTWRPLRVVLLMIPNLDCFSPRDRVFGMMGLLKEMDPDIPRFSNDVSVADLYTSFTRYILSKSVRNHHWWRYLNLSFNLRRTEGLPSWVPDLHYQRQPYIYTPASVREFQRNGESRYQASSKTTKFKLGTHINEIVIRGKIVDSIILVHPASSGLQIIYGTDSYSPGAREDMGDSDLQAFIDLDAWEDIIARTVLSPTSEEHRSNSTDAAELTPVHIRITKDTYWQTLMGGNTFDVVSGSELTQETWDGFRTALRQFATVVQKITRYVLPPYTPISAVTTPRYFIFFTWNSQSYIPC